MNPRLKEISDLAERIQVLCEAEAANDAPAAQDAPGPAPQDLGGLAQPDQFFAVLRASKLLGASLEQSEVNGCNAILAACHGWVVSWAAYALATALHETAGTMQPIKEIGSAAYFHRMYDPQGSRPQVAATLGNTQPGDGVRYAGRGYVQLTGRANYAKAEQKIGAPFLTNPDLAMQPDHAARIMREGMDAGWFTGKGLNSYLPAIADVAQFTQARRIINGTDRAQQIATYAMSFQNALMAGGWK